MRKKVKVLGRGCLVCHLILYNCCRVKTTQKMWQDDTRRLHVHLLCGKQWFGTMGKFL